MSAESRQKKPVQLKKGAAMWAKRYRSKPGHAQEGYYYSIRLADGVTWMHLRKNPFKRPGDTKPDFI